MVIFISELDKALGNVILNTKKGDPMWKGNFRNNKNGLFFVSIKSSIV
jgi:hypothetical protein